MKEKRFFLITVILIVVTGSVFAQGIEDNVSVYKSANGSLYLQPLADAFGANLNSGLFHTAKINKVGLHLQIGVRAMYAPIADAKKIFEPVPEGTWTPPANSELPTVFGSEEQVDIGGSPFPGGAWDTNFFPLAVPQVTFGDFLGTRGMIRYITYNIDDEIGEIKLFGWGIQHSISQYIFLCPIDISIGFYSQKFDIGSIIEASALYYGVQASKSFSILTLYGGVGMEKSTLDISYDYTEGNETTRILFELDGENTTRITMGFALNLYLLKIYADYSIASQQVMSAGVAFGI